MILKTKLLIFSINKQTVWEKKKMDKDLLAGRHKYTANHDSVFVRKFKSLISWSPKILKIKIKNP